MSSELERGLREARESLPAPDEDATQRARARSIASVRRRRTRTRIVVLVGAMLVAAVAFGVSASTFAPPSGTASGGPRGLGFLPEPGWYVLQSGAGASTSRPAVAIASNVPFAREDDIKGLAESSAFPYSTLLSLPPRGVVIVAVVTPRGVEPWADGAFHPMKLPLRLANTRVVGDVTGFRVRHDQPLGQYGIAAAVNDHNVAVTLYFGREHPEGSQLATAQRQLSQLVVRSPRIERSIRRPAGTESPAMPVRSVVDRTVVCTTQPSGGVREVETRGHDGVREAGSERWFKLPYAAVATGGVRSIENALDNSLVWISAGRPVSTTTVDYAWSGVHPHVTGTFALSTRNCRTSSARIPLTRTGLQGGSPGKLGSTFDCVAPRRILIRVRAVFPTSPRLRGVGGFLKTTQPISEASFAVRSEGGMPLAYAEAFQSGRARLYTGSRCDED